MENFIVSARKYRPQNFSSVVGQSHITTTLKNAIRYNQLAHAFLFCGPRGVGKTTCARILGKTINCENQGSDGEPCNQCPSCVSFNEGTSLNIHELDAASNNSVDDIRTLVEQVRFAPQAGKYKVYIIDEVHMLSSSAFNAFLKTLEEPPSYAIFILATTEKHKILPTILSRCQIFDFKRITMGDTVGHLQEICSKEEIKADTASLQVIAQKSEGCMRDALSILDKIVSFTNGEVTYKNTLEHLNILDADYYFRLLDAMLGQNLTDAMLLYDNINSKGFEGDLVLNGFSEFIRNLLVCKDEKAARLLEVVENFRDAYLATAKKTDTAFLISVLNILSESELNYKIARNKRLHVELALIRLCYLQQAIELVNSGEVNGKKKLTDVATPVAFRIIQPVEIDKKRSEPNTQKKETGEARLIIETSSTPTKKLVGPGSGAAARENVPNPDEKEPATSLGALSKIRQQVVSRKTQDADNTAKTLEMSALQDAWDLFTRHLRDNKNSAAQSFQRALLKITDNQTFEVISNNNLELKFIEQEKRNLTDHLQQVFNNKNITLLISIRALPEGQEEPAERQLSKKEQYQQISEQYPGVKELKDRLKLELDY
jgi:DNA polymerase-3 subunit gamma/tau